MLKILVILILFLRFYPLAQPVSLSGKVTDQKGNPIAGAVVILLSKDISSTTDASGIYSLKTTTVSNLNRISLEKNKIYLNNNDLIISLSKPSSFCIEVFDINGSLLKSVKSISSNVGEYHYNLVKNISHSKVMLVRVTIGSNSLTFYYFSPSKKCRNSVIRKKSRLTDDKNWLAQQSIKDTLLVCAPRYNIKKLPISSYEGTIDITLELANCNYSQPSIVNVNFTGKAFSGTHEVTVETNPGLLKFTIFRPKDMGPGKKYPILAWGQGGCSTNGLSCPEFHGEIVSHGYFLIADGTPNGSNGGCGSAYSMDLKGGKCLLDAIHWAIKENSNPCSPYFLSLDTTKTAAFGFSCGGIMAEGAGSSNDPVLTTFMLNSSGLTSPNQSVIDAFRTPVLFLLGGSSDIAYENGKRDYNSIKAGTVPAMLVSTNVGHGGTYSQDNGGSFAQVDLAWLNWWLKGDYGATGKGFFTGSTCKICNNSEWEIMSKNLP